MFRQTNESVLRKFTHLKKNNTVEANSNGSANESRKFSFSNNESGDDEVLVEFIVLLRCRNNVSYLIIHVSRMDVYSFLATSPSPVISSNERTIAEIINESKADSNGGILSNEVASHVICLLSQKVDR